MSTKAAAISPPKAEATMGRTEDSAGIGSNWAIAPKSS